MQKIIGLSIVALMFSVPSLGWAADAVCRGLKGEVLIKTGGADQAYRARSGDPLYFGDEVRTAAGAVVHVYFNDGATVLVKENSTFKIKGTQKDTWVVFDIGEFLIGLKKKLSPKSKFQIKTPAAAAAVRGTLFWGLSDASKDTTYACFSDSILITAGGKTLTLEKGQTVKIPYGKAPEEPAPANVPLSYLDTFSVDGTIQGLDTLAK